MGDVARSRLGECLKALLAEDRVGEPAVSRVGFSAHGSRSSRRFTTRDKRESDALVTSASRLIRMVCSGLFESMART